MWEVKNVALIEKVRWVVEHSDSPFFVENSISTRRDMAENFFRLSNQRSENELKTKDPVPMTSAKAITRCHGWLRIDQKCLPPDFNLRCARGRPAYYERAEYYYAIVYDHVPVSAGVDISVLKANVDFFELSGFKIISQKPNNWRQSKLVDFGDIESSFEIRLARTVQRVNVDRLFTELVNYSRGQGL
jgi:hypothetical protein